jgi:hypothetical protein
MRGHRFFANSRSRTWSSTSGEQVKKFRPQGKRKQKRLPSQPEKVEVNKWDFNAEDLDAEVQRIVTMMNEREDQFMERREAEVRKEMRSQFEIEKRLEKELASKENAEKARAELMKLLHPDESEN